jgi:type IV pilus assembly protein PilB
MAKRLGQILMETGLLSIDELTEALDAQKSTGQMLGEILINMNMVNQDDLEMALKFQEEDED